MFGLSKAIGLLPLVSQTAVLAMRLKNPFLDTTSHSTVDLIPHQSDQKASSVADTDESDPSILVQYTDLYIDNFGNCSDTFKNRYFVKDKYYKPGGPIILFDAGEQDATGALGDLKEGSWFVDLLQELGAMGIEWEHRFYGKSIPQPWRDYIQYLTYEQALADLPVMAANFTHPNWLDHDLSPASTPWVMFGCSYGGTRAAAARQTYPDTFYAAVAGGAVVQWDQPGGQYYLPIMRGMRSFGEGGCVTDVQTANKRLQGLLEDPETRAPTKRWFFSDFPSFQNVSNADMQYILSGTFDQWQYSKNKIIKKFCDELEHDPETNTTAPPEGWTGTKTPEWILQRMAETYGYTGGSSKRDLEQSARRALLRPRADVPNAWGYQTATQLDSVVLYDPALEHFTLDFATHEFWNKINRRAWPNATLVTPADAIALDRKYGGWNMRPSNLLWTTGEYDPWQNRQPLSLNGNAPEVTVLSKPPKCNAQLPQDQIFGKIVKGETHCSDMYWKGTNPEKRATRKLFADSLKEWLPCFEKKDKASICPQTPAKCSSK